VGKNPAVDSTGRSESLTNQTDSLRFATQNSKQEFVVTSNVN